MMKEISPKCTKRSCETREGSRWKLLRVEQVQQAGDLSKDGGERVEEIPVGCVSMVERQIQAQIEDGLVKCRIQRCQVE